MPNKRNTTPLDEFEYCPNCKRRVIPEGKLDVTGITNTCPNCGSDTLSDKQLRKDTRK